MLLIIFCISIITKADLIGDLIVEMEGNLLWSAVDGKWAGRRNAWVIEMQKVNNLQKTIDLFMELESVVVPDAYLENWGPRKSAWQSETKSTLIFTRFSRLILEFESNLKSSALTDKWANRRVGWRKEFEGLASTRKIFSDEVRNEFFEFNFNNSELKEAGGNGPSLIILGPQGSFIKEPLPQLGGQVKNVYRFPKNGGLQFNNKEAGNLLKETYTIELYFRFDMLDNWKRVIDFKNRKSDNGAYIYEGKLNFYRAILSELAPVKAGEYTHFVISRDRETKEISIYANGVARIKFKDQYDLGVLDEDNILTFFCDDKIVSNETSSGAVAMIRLYGYKISPEEISKKFEQLSSQLKLEEPEPDAVVIPVFKGKVLDAKSKLPVQGARIVVNNDPKMEFLSSFSGEFSFNVSAPSEAKFKIKAKGFMDYSVIFGLEGEQLNKEFYLTPIEVGETFTLNNIIFQQSLAEMLPESLPELDNLVMLLKENPTMEIELSGHTDNQGDPEKNQKLSEDRVKAVMEYLTSMGIEKKRLKGKGYGGTRPIASNSKEETRKLNRRVEFTIMKK
ncbi:MAG: OmpA family protein [Cytophagaceae bacterium]